MSPREGRFGFTAASRPGSGGYLGAVCELDELVVGDQSAWEEVLSVVLESPHVVEVLPVDEGTPASCLRHLQVTTASWLGAVAYRSGGIVVDGGWLRVLGSGSTARRLIDIVAANQ